MGKRLVIVTTLAVVFCAALSWAKTAAEKEQLKRLRMEEIARNLPDSVFENVKVEDLLNDEVYLKLSYDGWSPREIMTIMETAVKDKKKAKEKIGYGYYAKQWRPTYGRSLGDDPLYQFTDSGLSPMAIAGIYAAVGENDYNRTWEFEAYDPAARKRADYQRSPGYFRQVQFNPSSGRTHWIVANQDNDEGKEIYAIPDNAGIFSTTDGGKTWKCITDNIPERANRSYSPGYSLPIDPDNWKHIFAFMANSSVYETTDGGETWRRIAGATHKNFKRGYCFRDGEGTLRFIGAEPHEASSKLWISDDTCKTWTEVKLPDNFKEKASGGFWFQQIIFPKKHTDMIYFPGSQSILYMEDGGRGTETNGTRTYTLKRLSLNITGQSDSVPGVVRDIKNADYFPFDGDGPGFMEVNPWNKDMMWFATGHRSTNKTALYFTQDGGENWVTLHEPTANIGSGSLFGNESPWNWLGGFGVQFVPNDVNAIPQNLFGCTMSSAYSRDGGKKWTEYAWGTRQKSYLDNKIIPLAPNTSFSNGEGYYYVSASRHNADNHCIFSHKSGKVFRGGDGGFFVHDPAISGEIPAIGEADWVNISSNMGQMLFYNVRVNEFGDQAIIGNSQDIDVQTYRYGRWGHWRGYEGSEASFNPYTSTGYFSGGGGDGPEGMEPNSWNTARNFADVVTGSWFMLRTWNGNASRSTLYRVDDIGRSLTDLYPAINQRVTDFTMSRDGGLTVFIKTADNAIHMSTDSCKTFVPLYTNTGVQAKFSNTRIAADPDNANVFYIGQNAGKVWKYLVKEGTFTAVGTGLPTTVNCSRILFHEGSGDLYYVDYNSGIYILKNGDTEWKFWTRGYNNSKFNDVDINYTTQEMVLSDYGRGVWVADLETPADRYFRKDFPIKELSHRNGRRVFGIDTKWTIPMYYNFRWIVNGVDVENSNYQYLSLDDKQTINSVRLELSLREAPDVKTLSKELKPEQSVEVPLDRHQGNALYSNGMGRVDIGYMDWFDQDFSVDMWLKPQGDGVILANSQKSVEKGAKGWVLYIEGGILKFKYYPSNVLQQPTYEATITQKGEISGTAVPMNKWSHIAVTQKRKGNITLYINGTPVGSAPRIRQDEEHGLNNSVIMSLFGDAFETGCLQGAVDELKVWNKELGQADIQREMFSTGLGTDGLVAHFDFNGDKLENNSESFAGRIPVSRTRAVTHPERMTVPVSANYVADKVLTGDDLFIDKNKMPLMTIKGEDKLKGVNTVVYGYDAHRWDNADDNLSEEYYEPTDYGYMVRTFGTVSPDATADITFHNGNGNFDQNKSYRLYTADNAEDRMYWKLYPGTLAHDGGNLKIEGARLSEIVDRKLLLVNMKPAIEMEIEGLSSDGRIVLYDDGDDKTQFKFTARLIEGKTLADNRYEIMSDSTVLILPEKPLSFDNANEAKGEIKVDVDLIGPFNNTISTYIRGKEDATMIPIPVDILNRISPLTLNNGVKITKGGLKFGTAADFAALKGSTTYTIMGWVRFDDANMLITGRNNDGVSPLMFFRTTPSNAGTTGINLKRFGSEDFARLGYHINDNSTTYNAQSNFKIYKNDVGRWFHVALVVKPQEVLLYLNGMKQKMTAPNPIPECTAESPLLLGMNVQGGNTYFSGAFDHVAMWNRSLDDEEIHKYMHNRVLLNDPGLMAYITMDEFTENGSFKESVKGLTAVKYGTVAPETGTPVPFAPFRQDVSMKTEGCPIHLSSTTAGCVASFEGTPYNYVAEGTEAQTYLPLNNRHYTLIYDALPSVTTGDVTMTYNYESLIDGEEIAVGIRRLGSTAPYDRYFTASSVKGQKAVFTIPAENIAESSELMFFSTPESNHRPTIVRMGFHNSAIENGGIHLLADGESTIDVDVNVISGTGEVHIVPTESYVTVSNPNVDMSHASQTVTVTIDKNELRKTNPFGLSDVTLKLEGTEADPLTVKVGLQPRIALKLKNGSDATHFTARNPVSTLDIETELVEGYLDHEVKLKLTPESMNSSMSIANGSLLVNEPVTISELKYGQSSDHGLSSGWNLIGNPYLTEINLTKKQNYDYEGSQSDGEKALTHFVYHTLNGSDNIVAFDMTDYDGEQHIAPFQSYYVQTMTDNAEFTVTNVAKERELSRKTFDYYTATEVRGVTLKLVDESGTEIDRTTVRWQDGSSVKYALNEDAPKVHSVNGQSNELYTVTEDGVETSINFQPDNISNIIVPVNINVRQPGNMKLVVSRLSGFDTGDNKLYLADLAVGGDYTDKNILATDKEYEFSANKEGTLDGRFYLVPTYNNDKPTGSDDTMAPGAHEYRVYTDNRTIRITGLQGDAEISIFNTSGMLVARDRTDRPEYTTHAEPGYYVVKIRENEKDYVTKIFVK